MIFGLILLIVVAAIVLAVHLIPLILTFWGFSHIAKKIDEEEAEK